MTESQTINWDDMPTEHLQDDAPAEPAAAVVVVVEDAAPTTLWGKVRLFFKGAKTVVIGGLLLGLSAISMFDPDSLPLDAIIRMFVTDEDVAAKVMGTTTIVFLALRFLSPGLLVGLKLAYSKNKES